jgi:hypothetical protein
VSNALSRNERLTLAVSIASLAFGAISLGISWTAFYRTEAEQFTVSLSAILPEVDSVTLIPGGDHSGRPAVAESTLTCLLSNTGNRAISIVRYQVWFENKNGDRTEDRIDRGLYETSGKPITLPLSLEAGQSRRVTLKAGYPLHPKAQAALVSRYGYGSSFSRLAAQIELAKLGFDMRGRPAFLRTEANGLTLNGPDFWETLNLAFQTSRGLTVHDAVDWWGSWQKGPRWLLSK